jgi:hypothetical protein
MDRLLKIGFEVAGHWRSEEGVDRIQPEIIKHARQINILYAFVCDGAVMYVGKTVQTLARRMSGYSRPVPAQITNMRVNEKIRAVMQAGQAVDILALPDSGLMHYGVFHLNLAAALEDDIIRQLDPLWNGGRKESALLEANDALATAEAVQKTPPNFDIVIGPTYRNQGFFNVPARAQKLFGSDSEKVEIDLSEEMPTILGTINRRCNRGNNPRIMGGVALQRWIQANFNEGEAMQVEVISPISIRLRVPSRIDPGG